MMPPIICTRAVLCFILQWDYIVIVKPREHPLQPIEPVYDGLLVIHYCICPLGRAVDLLLE